MKKNQQYLDELRHTCAHLLAKSVLELWPGSHNAIGPAIENGFYQDFDMGDVKVSEADLPKIEKKMRDILPKWTTFTYKKATIEEVRKLFAHNPYKVEMAEEFAKEGKELLTNNPGDFLDLCKMNHIDNPSKEMQHFKLLSVAGAYWRGDEKNKMLTRIYGACFPTKKELDEYLHMLEEAKKRDHRVLGKKLDLFVLNEDIGKGLPLLTPKGTIIRNEIIAFERELEREYGFEEVWSPHIAKNDLYKKTGHWQHYKDVMYAPFGIENETYVLKPMNCPHHYMIYASKPRSYKDLPIRLSEVGTCYRYEKSGELGGLARVRALSIDDSHILMTEDQIHKEFDICIDMVKQVFKAFGLHSYWVRLSLADPNDAVKYIADEKTWKKAGKTLETIIRNNKLEYEIASGEASFYGPKIDFMVKDVIGREWQMSTLQLDLFMAKRLNLVYTDKNGKDKHPVIIHRGLTGSLERTIGILIEHFAGAFPLWLAPVQLVLIPIAERHGDHTKKLMLKLRQKNIRVSIDDRNETMQSKIREATLQKVPYMGIIGDREQKNSNISVRTRDGNDLGALSLDSFVSRLESEIEKKS